MHSSSPREAINRLLGAMTETTNFIRDGNPQFLNHILRLFSDSLNCSGFCFTEIRPDGKIYSVHTFAPASTKLPATGQEIVDEYDRQQIRQMIFEQSDWGKSGEIGGRAAYIRLECGLIAIIVNKKGESIVNLMMAIYGEHKKSLEDIGQLLLLRQEFKTAYTDFLTGLLGKRAGVEALCAHYSQAWRNKQGMTICFGDVDNFGDFNKRYGHHVGDLVLREVGYVLSHTCRRANEMVCRYGGEESIACSTGAAEQTPYLGKRICDAIRNHNYTIPPGATPITITVGQVIIPHDQLLDPTLVPKEIVDGLLAQQVEIAALASDCGGRQSRGLLACVLIAIQMADDAMRHGKRTGKDHCCISKVTMQQQLEELRAAFSPTNPPA